MSKSLQHRLDSYHPPRVHITYDVDTAGATEKRELPFVVGILSHLTQASENNPLAQRKFVDISFDTFSQVMGALSPVLKISVTNEIQAEPKQLDVALTFKSIDDFRPLAIVKAVPEMSQLYTSRTLLKDFLVKLDVNYGLQEIINEVLRNKDSLKKLVNELANPTVQSSDLQTKAGSLSILDTILYQGKMIHSDDQQDYAIAQLNELTHYITTNKDSIVPSDVFALTQQRIAQIDTILQNQLNVILHHPDFLAIEGVWRGAHYLVNSTIDHEAIKFRILNVTKDELLQDFEKAVVFDQSFLFQKIYESEFDTYGGVPFSCIVGDYSFARDPQDIDLLTHISGVCAAAHAPFITGADAKLFDLSSFKNLHVPRDLSATFETVEMVKWQNFRSSDDSRYVCLTLPRVMARLPYGSQGQPVEGLAFEEVISDGQNDGLFCWMNAAYALTTRLVSAFEKYHWTTAIRGVEGGGLVTDLPVFSYLSDSGDAVLKLPTEVSITDRREKELSNLGFIPLCSCKDQNYAAFFSCQTVNKPKDYSTDFANGSAKLSARLSYMLAASRFAHYLKIIMRDKVGNFETKETISQLLNGWIAQYVLLNDSASQELKAQYPLREASIEVYDVPGQPGDYKATVLIRPHFQMEDLTVSIRLVTELPKASGG